MAISSIRVFRRSQDKGSLAIFGESARVLNAADIAAITGAIPREAYFNSEKSEFYVGDVGGTLEVMLVE